MEEAPKGTFEDELDWCIRQLETGLFRQNPTARQGSDTQKILQVLRSRKAPFVKKRQVMNQVFGDYRLKMAEERRALEKAAKKMPAVKIQEVTTRGAQSVAYRKSPRELSNQNQNWFSTSDNSFTFNFCPDQTDNGSGNTEDGQVKESGCNDLNLGGHSSAMCTGESSGFSFNFQITVDEGSPSQSPQGQKSGDQLNQNLSVSAAIVAAQKDLSENRGNLKGTASQVTNQTIRLEGKGENTSDPPKKKKKKSKTQNQSAQAQSMSDGPAGTTLPLKDEPQSAAKELRRELDWCMEQIEIGLQRQKATSKHVEEALRNIKILKSEKAPLVKKRQLMRTMFGDYRRKMEEEKQKQFKLMQAAAKSARVTEVSAAARQKSSKVFRKSTQNSHSNVRKDHSIPSVSPKPSESTAEPGTSEERFMFRSSQEPFCFNFF